MTKIVTSNFAFAALKTDGSVQVWGNSHYGGSVSSTVAVYLTSGVKLICANEVAFTAIKTDGCCERVSTTSVYPCPLLLLFYTLVMW